jgi:RNA polymerase sigma-70 factor (ECF subfamily)
MVQEEQQFLESYDAYADSIFRHCYFRVYSKERAEELVQETFMRTWQYMQKGKPVENMRAFLYRIANNLIIDYSRKKKELSLEGVLEKDPSLEPSGSIKHNPAHLTLLQQMRDALTKLPKETAELLTLRYIDGLEPREIAEVLGASPGAISVRLNRAAVQLKEIMNPE